VITESVQGNAQPAFELLVDVVRDLHARQRQTLLQGVKPLMQRTSMGNFSETALGFGSFGEFVREAERRGLIECRPEPGGISLHLPGEPHVEHSPSGASPVPQPSRTSSGRRMRRDLWVAFVDWDTRFMRVWDRMQRRALRLPAESVPLETQDQAALRASAASDTERYVRITPVGIERQLEWMRTFAAQHETTAIGPALKAALDPGVQRPVHAFSQTLRIDPLLKGRWNTQRLALVAEHVMAWARENQVEVTLWEELDVKSAHPQTPQAAGADRATRMPSAEATVDELRVIVQRAVNQMSRAELLRLPLTLDLLLDDSA
jgi:hypothetical protein